MPTTIRVDLRFPDDHPIASAPWAEAEQLVRQAAIDAGPAPAGVAPAPQLVARWLNNGQPPDRRNHAVVRTDAAGRFRFPPREGPCSVLVVHDRGYARVESDRLSEDPDVTIQEWGRVEGVLRIGSRPGIGEQIHLGVGRADVSEAGQVHFSYEATTDDEGHFVIEHVPAGPAQVSRSIRLNDRSTTYNHAEPVQIRPGETARVTIGGTGRPVVGRVVAPDGLPGPIDFAIGFNRIGSTPPTANPGVEQVGDVLAGIVRALSSRIGPSSQPPASRSFAVNVEPDGSFRVDDIPAGSYRLSIQVHEPLPGDQPGFGELLGTASLNFDVPAMSEGRPDEPMDVGTVELVPTTRLQVGEPAPGFAVETLDGDPLRLADYRGRFVLLDFWATWCGPCVAETPHLNAVFEEFGDDPRFVMIALSLDTDPEAPRAYAAEHDLRWTQGFLGDWSTSPVPESFGVRGIPSIWLIDSDGTVIAKDL